MDASDYCSGAHSGKDAHLPVWLLWLMYQIYAPEHKIMSCNELQIAPQLAAKKELCFSYTADSPGCVCNSFLPLCSPCLQHDELIDLTNRIPMPRYALVTKCFHQLLCL